MSRTLTRPDANKGLIIYANAKGANTCFAMAHIVSYTELPNNSVSVVTTGGQQILSFGNSTDRDAATALLNIALEG